jgi:Galactose oxidase, central domain
MLDFYRLSSALALAVATAIAGTALGCGSAPTPDIMTTLSVRNAHSMVYDNDHEAVMLFGGADATRVCGDTWQWDAKKHAWRFVTGDGPQPRTFASVAYDERRHEAILFGGNRVLFGKGDESDTFLADTWRLQDEHWTRSGAKGPPPRAEASIAYDRDRERIVLFGGYRRTAGVTERLGDTWEWDGEQWSEVAVDGPTPRNSAAMTYDELRHRIVLFGGPGPSNETWEWDGRRWISVHVGAVPGRFNPVMIYDIKRGTVVRFGGWTGKERVGDTWALSDGGWFLLNVSGPPPRNHAAIAYDRRRRCAVLFGGHDGENVFGDTWEWDGVTWTRAAFVAPEKRVDNGH